MPDLSYFHIVTHACITFGPSGPGAPGIPLGPCRPVEPISPLSPGIPRSPCGGNETSCYCELNPHCKLQLLWKKSIQLTLGPICPTEPSSPGIPWKRWSCIVMWTKVAIRLFNVNQFRKFICKWPVIIKSDVRSCLCLTYDIAWFARFSRRSLVSR